jgi:hypothetical protein
MVLGDEPLSQVTFVTCRKHVGHHHFEPLLWNKKIGTGAETSTYQLSQTGHILCEMDALEKSENRRTARQFT